MGDLVIILIVAVGLVLGVRATIKHVKGQGGGCCGGGRVAMAPKKAAEKADFKVRGIESIRR